MPWEEIVGQPIAVRQLKNAIKRDHVGHAYLFLGPEGVGKRTTARIFAQALNCKDSTKGEACGKCRVCCCIIEGNYPELIEVSPLGKSVRIDQVREIIKQIPFRPSEGEKKVFLITHAERMTVEAANSLLKILEDPPEYVVFILTANSTLNLLPTVLSRCQQIRFQPLTPVIIEDYLVKHKMVGIEQSAYIAYLADGSLKVAQEILHSQQFSIRDNVLELLSRMEVQNDFQVLFSSKEWEETSQIKVLLQVLSLWFRDLMIWQQTKNSKFLINKDRIELIKKHVLIWNKAEDMLGVIQDMQNKLEQNANGTLLLEVLLVKLCEHRGGLVSANSCRGPI